MQLLMNEHHAKHAGVGMAVRKLRMSLW